ncbi:MAG: HAMP domain-containing histidine kinase [Clostridium sp.]|nr:HAMP domain-containing histidine kinase [Clostridium sp.]MBP3215640.1 HAMP domain-containing histidine kinase [Clostridium sp.]
MHRDLSGQFHSRLLVQMVFAAAAACTAELFLVVCLTALKEHLQRTAREPSVLLGLLEMDALMMLFYVLGGIVIFAAVYFRLLDRTIRDLGEISAAMQSISEGDLNTSVEVHGDDEVAMMAENLNKMVGDLRTLMDRERESERTKNELITNVAHDLRTPLTSIIGYLELLSISDTMSPEMQKKYIDIAFAKSKRLQQLIEDLFSFTKLGGGKVALKIGRVDIVRLLNQLLEEFYPSFLAQNLSYELTSNVPAKVISADSNLLARLFDNLINNAIKYGADGKRVIVRIDAEEDMVTVRVKNYGYVIPEDEVGQIFNRFYRVDQSRTSSVSGSGLGLAIAKNIVDMHGGTIGVTSDLNGTVFTVKLKCELDADRENFDIAQ